MIAPTAGAPFNAAIRSLAEVCALARTWRTVWPSRYSAASGPFAPDSIAGGTVTSTSAICDSAPSVARCELANCLYSVGQTLREQEEVCSVRNRPIAPAQPLFRAGRVTNHDPGGQSAPIGDVGDAFHRIDEPRRRELAGNAHVDR